ncbi:unnamed protein product [Linum trigynum]|uniref:S-protein homolog n=1 Tax=Linum trigynum TaxID=586398 RepID=A0AAV2CBQ8_9ROSI
MKHNNAIILAVLLFLLSAPATMCHTKSDLIRPHTTVVVVNKLDGERPLKVHCQSHDYDLGLRMLMPHQQLNWSFRNNIFENERFNCSMEWGGEGGGVHWFDIYDEHRDFERCTYCRWLIKQTGPCLCLYDRESCSHWKTPPPVHAAGENSKVRLGV